MRETEEVVRVKVWPPKQREVLVFLVGSGAGAGFVLGWDFARFSVAWAVCIGIIACGLVIQDLRMTHQFLKHMEPRPPGMLERTVYSVTPVQNGGETLLLDCGHRVLMMSRTKPKSAVCTQCLDVLRMESR